MSQPPPYDRQFNFQNQALLTPNDPPPADEMDAEFNAVKLTLDATLGNLALIQRDDGAVANDSIGFDQLKDEALTDIQPVLDARDATFVARDAALTAQSGAQASAAGAASSASAAATSETNAALAETAAEVAQSLAEVARAGAQDAETAVETVMANLAGTSVTSNTIGTGSKSFTTQTFKEFDPGAWLLITSDAAPAVDYMHGVSTAYSGASLTVDVQTAHGSGAHTDWSIRVSGIRGADGASGAGTGDVIAPATNSNDFIPQWNGTNSKTLKDGIDPATLLTTAAAASTYQPLDADLTSIAALTTTAAGRSTLTIADPNADRVIAWDDTAGSMAALALTDLTTEAAPAAGDYALIYGAEGDLRKVDWSIITSAGVSDGDKGDITVTGSGATWTIDNAVVTYAKIQNIATDSLIGRDTAATGVPEAITVGGGIEFTGAGALRITAFTGDVTKTAGGTALTIADDTVTYAKLQNISVTGRFLGRITAGAGDAEELTGTQATTLLDPFTSALKGLAPASGGGTTNFLRADGAWAVPVALVSDGDKGDVVVSSGGTIWTIDTGVVTLAKLANIPTDTLIGRDTAVTGVPESITVTGGIEFSGAGSIQTSAFTGDVTKTAGGTALTIANDVVTYAKMQNISATARFIGRFTAGSGDAEEITGTQATTLLDNFTSALKGLAPASGGGTTNFLRADGTWTAPTAVVADGDKGDITVSASGATWTIDNTVVTYAKIQNVSATSRFLGRITAGAGSAEELTGTQATTLLDAFTTSLKGLAPASGGGTVNFLRADGTWNVPGAALAASDRQNFALSAIYQSKAFAGYRRMVNFFADGYKATDGVASGSSSNYSVDTTNGRVAPTLGGGTTVTIGTRDSDNGPFTSTYADVHTAITNSVTVYAIGIYSATAGSVTLKILKKNSPGNYDVVYSQVVSHSGSAAFEDFTLTTPFSVPGSGNYYLAAYITSGTVGFTTAVSRAYASGDLAVGTGYTLTEDTAIAPALRYIHTMVPNNMTVVTTAQTADASVSTARALIEFNPIDSITLNTDLTVDLTCNGGTNWAAATLSSVTVNGQAGRDVAETAATACTSGTSFQARVKNLNNKSVQVYGVTVQVS